MREIGLYYHMMRNTKGAIGEIVIETRNQGKGISWYGLLDSMRRIGDFDFIGVLKDA